MLFEVTSDEGMMMIPASWDGPTTVMIQMALSGWTHSFGLIKERECVQC